MISEEEIAAMETDASSGWNIFKVSDRVHGFLSKLESHIHIGANFECLTPIEFDWIVEIKNNENDEEDDLKKEKTTKGYELEK